MQKELDLATVKLAIGIPCNFPMIPIGFFESFIEMRTIPFMYIRGSMGSIDEMRNSIVYRAIEQNCTHLMMIDTDMILHPDTVEKLVKLDTDICAPLFFRRYPPFDPLIKRGTINAYTTVEDWEKDSVIEVDAIGSGVILIKTEVFEKMPFPWFQTIKEMRPEGKYVVGEDINFCAKARDLGYKILVDTSIQAGHISGVAIDETFYKLFKVIKQSQKLNSH